MKFFVGSALLMPSMTKLVLTDNDSTSLQKVLAVNAQAVNHSFAGVLGIDDIIKQLDPVKTVDAFLAARPVVTDTQRHYFGGIYSHMPQRILFEMTRIKGSSDLPILTVDGVLVKFEELHQLLDYFNGSITIGDHKVGGRTVQFGGAVGEVRPLVEFLGEYIEWVKEANTQSFYDTLERHRVRMEQEQQARRMPKQPEPVAPDNTRTARSISLDFKLSPTRVVKHLNRLYKGTNGGKDFTYDTLLDNEVNKLTRMYYASIDTRK